MGIFGLFLCLADCTDKKSFCKKLLLKKVGTWQPLNGNIPQWGCPSHCRVKKLKRATVCLVKREKAQGFIYSEIAGDKNLQSGLITICMASCRRWTFLQRNSNHTLIELEYCYNNITSSVKDHIYLFIHINLLLRTIYSNITNDHHHLYALFIHILMIIKDQNFIHHLNPNRSGKPENRPWAKWPERATSPCALA